MKPTTRPGPTGCWAASIMKPLPGLCRWGAGTNPWGICPRRGASLRGAGSSRTPPWPGQIMERKKVKPAIFIGLFIILLAGCVTVKVSLFEEPEPLKEKVVSGAGRDKILLLDISGVVFEGRGILWKLMGTTGPSRVKEELDKAARDK